MTMNLDDLQLEVDACRVALKKARKENHALSQRLVDSESHLARLLDNLPGLAYRCHLDAELEPTLEFVSKGSFDLLGFEPEHLLKDNWNSIERMTHPDDLDRIQKEVRDALLERRPYKMMYRVQMMNGDRKWIWDQGEGVYDDSGVPYGLDGIIMDVSVQKMREIDLAEENERLKSSLKGRYRFGDIVGKSEPMQKVYNLILKASESDTNVIIYGETGTGKDLVARTVHELSAREGRFVPVNCGAIPEHLLESEFFGHKRGAFTGANTDKLGLLGAADGGTLFLDELGELDLNLQVKLLRAIESKQYTPVGDTRSRRSSFRIIAATNRDLKAMVRQGTMRPDFFYRIHVLPVPVPPLRERREDIPLLIEHFLSIRDEGEEPIQALPTAVRIALEDYDWPGNIRELQNILDRYVTFGEVNFADVSLSEEIAVPTIASQVAGAGMEIPTGGTLKDAVERLERTMIVSTLEQCRWRRGDAAKALGLNIRTMQRKMKKYGI